MHLKKLKAIMTYLMQFFITKQRDIWTEYTNQTKQDEVKDSSSKGDIYLHEIFVS